MKKKEKYIAIVVLVALVAIGLGAYYSPNIKISNKNYGQYIVYTNAPTIIPEANISGSGAKRTKSVFEQPEADFNSKFAAELLETAQKNSARAGGLANYENNASVSKRNSDLTKNKTSTSNALSANILSSSGAKSKSEIATAGSGAINSSNMSGSSPMALPYSPGTNDVLMADPSTDPIESNRIPVGEGAYFLSLIGIMYGFTLLKRKR